VAWGSTTWRVFRRAVTSEPVVLVSDGVIRGGALEAHRLTKSHVMQAIRSGGYGDISFVGAVVLEPNGTLSVIGRE
jgi:uncharacterized membrane protein YcaP (DUF421 family)